tara:strand:+ start:167 stop:319 length:153 start_codon:yes stop_codon:yes gene_type:complete
MSFDKNINKLRDEGWRKKSSLFAMIKNILLLILIILISVYILDIAEIFQK